MLSKTIHLIVLGALLAAVAAPARAQVSHRETPGPFLALTRFQTGTHHYLEGEDVRRGEHSRLVLVGGYRLSSHLDAGLRLDYGTVTRAGETDPFVTLGMTGRYRHDLGSSPLALLSRLDLRYGKRQVQDQVLVAEASSALVYRFRITRRLKGFVGAGPFVRFADAEEAALFDEWDGTYGGVEIPLGVSLRVWGQRWLGIDLARQIGYYGPTGQWERRGTGLGFVLNL